jgi:hypothetical protein
MRSKVVKVEKKLEYERKIVPGWKENDNLFRVFRGGGGGAPPPRRGSECERNKRLWRIKQGQKGKDDRAPSARTNFVNSKNLGRSKQQPHTSPFAPFAARPLRASSIRPLALEPLAAPFSQP